MSAPVMPPEEKFWQRYSPHNEFSLSGVGTLTVYLLFGLLILGGVKLSGLLTPTQDFSMGAIAQDFSEGDGMAAPERPGKPEAVEPTRIERPAVPATTPPVSLPSPPVGEIGSDPLPVQPHEDPLPAQAEELKKRFGKVVDSVPGILGGRQAEKGTENPGNGNPGKTQNKPRVAAMLRWNMVFDTKNGDDYRKQLEALGAILAVPSKDGQYQVIRNLTPPVKPAAENLQKLQRIFWIDDNAQSVKNLTTALQLAELPVHIVAFFPVELEQKLTELEKKFAGNKPVASVKETRFRILLNRQGVYEPVVVDQR